MLKEIDDLLSFVEVAGNAPITDSRKVAKHFGRQHAKVLRTVRQMIEDTDGWGVANFGHTPSVDSQNGQTYDCYQMTKDGFMLLVMGFTGKKALSIKLAFIRAFNAMADFIRGGLWQQRLDAEADLVQGRARASRSGLGLRRWQDEKPMHMQHIERIDKQMQLSLLPT